MSESSNVVPFVRGRFDPTDESHLVAAALTMIPPDPKPARRVIRYSSRQPGGSVDVWISWEAQCAIAGTEELTTDQILAQHAGDFDRQIALLIAGRTASRLGEWTLDASDIVPII